MILPAKKTVLLLLIVIVFVISGLFLVKNIYNNRVPKSAKLVLFIKNNDYMNGKNKSETLLFI